MSTAKFSEMLEIVNSICYKEGWKIDIKVDECHRPYIQVGATTPCSMTGELAPWKSGKQYLSWHMCRQEVVSAVYGLIERAELHECREFFRYKGASIFNPHLDPDVLAQVARKKESFCVRENAMTMYEEGN